MVHWPSCSKTPSSVAWWRYHNQAVPNHQPDENSAPNQDDHGGKPDVVGADRARGVPGAEPPLEKTAAKEGHRHTSAAGLVSVWETTKRGGRLMGVRRSLKTLVAINQKDGFDCPSCAWPDPDGERKTARAPLAELAHARERARARGPSQRGREE